MCMLFWLILPYSSFRFCPFFFFLILFTFCSSDLVIHIVLSSLFCWFFFPSPKICFWVLSVNISFQLLYFSALIFILLGQGSGFLCLYWYFCFGHASFSWFSLSSFSSLSFFKITVFIDLPSGIFQGQFLLAWFLFFCLFLFFCCWKLAIWNKCSNSGN